MFYESAIENVQLPSTLRKIENYAFVNCRNLRSIRLPERLEKIGERCFCGCRLADIAFPASVEEIGERAFYGNRLRQVTFEKDSRLTTVGGHAFGGND